VEGREWRAENKSPIVIPSAVRNLLLLALAPRAAQIGEAADDTDTALKPLTKER